MQGVVVPTWNQLREFLQGRYPLISRILLWKFRKKIDEINRKYLSGERNAKAFAKYKSYRLLSYRLTEKPSQV